MATVEGDANSEFSAALTTSFEDLIQQNASEGLLASKNMFYPYFQWDLARV